MNPSQLPGAAVAQWRQCFQAGQLAESEALAQALTAAHPAAAKAWQLLGMSRYAQGDPEAAQRHLRRAIALERRDPSIWDNLGLVLQRLGDHGGAREAFRAALALSPKASSIWSNAAGNEFDAGDAAAAVRLARRAQRLSPGLAAPWLQLGNALARLGRLEEAGDALRQALGRQPKYVEALLSLSAVQAAQGRYRDARAAAAAALRFDPGCARAHINLGGIDNTLGDLAAARAHYRRARELNPADFGSWSSELYCLSHDADQDPQALYDAHREFGARLESRVGSAATDHPNTREPERRLRVGVLSGDFRDHPVARFLEPVWAALDSDRIALVAYDNAPADDVVARRLRGLAHQWIDVSALDDAALAARIRGDRIDVLIDHAGHTARNRLGVFARKPAPLQAMWVGYPGTSGLQAMDYRLVDPVIAPPGRLDHYFTERLAYLPLMLVLNRPEVLPALSPPPFRRKGCFTFGSFNRLNKLGEPVLALWAEVLRRTPDARLVLGAVPDAASATRLRERLAAKGVSEARLDFLLYRPFEQYLAAHGEIDLLLDAFPWTGGTTTHLGLWMGVPTLTLAGSTLAGRLGATALAAVGLQSLVAESAADYVDTAVHLAADPSRLTAARAELRARLEINHTRVPRQVARALEIQLRRMWRRWCAGLPPQVLSLPAPEECHDGPNR